MGVTPGCDFGGPGGYNTIVDIAENGAEGRETLDELTGGLIPDTVDALRDVRDLEQVYPLLHSLVGSSLPDFLGRAAAMESLVAAEVGSFSSEDLNEALYWIAVDRRPGILRTLRRSGWLDHDPSEGTTITPTGRWAYDILSFLHRRLRESELLPTLAGVEYALSIGLDPVHHLRSLRSRLVSLREKIEADRASHSEVVLRRSAKRLGDALDLSRQVRTVLDRVPVENGAARDIVRDIHDLLSRLHGMSANLQAAITEVGRQFLRLTAGMTVEQIVGSLMKMSAAELSEAGRGALLPSLVPPPLLTTAAVAWAAERQFSREREEVVAVIWEEPEEAPRSARAAEVPPEAARFLADLAAIEGRGRPAPLVDVIPGSTAGESFLRASLLAIVGGDGDGEGVAGRLGALRLSVTTEGDGWPEEIEAGPVRRLTPGRVMPDGGNAG